MVVKREAPYNSAIRVRIHTNYKNKSLKNLKIYCTKEKKLNWEKHGSLGGRPFFNSNRLLVDICSSKI
jgi:hypothetical protein